MTARSWIRHLAAATAILVLPFAAAWAAPMVPVAKAAPTVTPPLAAPPTAPVTVEEAVAFALRNSPTVTRAAQDVQIAEAQVGVAEANRLPDVTANANVTYNPSPTKANFEGQEVQLGSSLSTGLQLTATQPVWPPSRWRAPVTIAEAGVNISTQSLERTRQQIAYQVRQAFFQLLTAQELRQVAESAVQVAQTQLRLAEATVQAGLAAPLDVYQARAVLANAEVSLTQAQNAVRVARAGLATQMGVPAGSDIQIVAPAALPPVPDDAEPLVAEALANRPELVQLNYRRQQVRANMDLIRLEKQPLVNVQANYATELTGGSVFGSNGLTFGAAAALPLYNGGQTEAELEAARVQLAQIDTTASQLELGITFDVRQAWLNLQNAVEQLRVAQRQLEAANEALRIAEIRYQNGEGIVLEVEQARLQRTQAQTALANARFQAQVAAAALEFAVGAPPLANMETASAPQPATTAPKANE